MASYVLLRLTLALACTPFFVTCNKMSTDITTEAPKDTMAVDKSEMVDNSKGIASKGIMNDTNDLEAVMTMCNESFRTEMSYLVSLNESGSFPDETDKTPKCFLRCVMQTLKVASMEDGKIDPKRAAAIFADKRNGEDIDEIASFCAQRNEQCHCEMAYNFLKCLFSLEIEKNNYKSKS